DVLDVEDGEHHAFGITQGEFGSDELIAHYPLVHIEGDRHGPQRAAREAHFAADAVVIGARHETAQRRKRAVEQQFQVAQLTRCQVERRPSLGGGAKVGGPRLTYDERREGSAMRSDQMVCHAQSDLFNSSTYQAPRWRSTGSRPRGSGS